MQALVHQVEDQRGQGKPQKRHPVLEVEGDSVLRENLLHDCAVKIVRGRRDPDLVVRNALRDEMLDPPRDGDDLRATGVFFGEKQLALRLQSRGLLFRLKEGPRQVGEKTVLLP